MVINTKHLKKDRWKIAPILSYKRPLSIAVGQRRVGKSFRATFFLVKRALQRRKLSFMWLRVSKTEIDDAKAKFFADMEAFGVFPEYSFSVIGHIGYATELATGERFEICYFDFVKNKQNIKSIPFPDVEFIVLDEGIEEKTQNKYKNIYEDLMSIGYSVFSLRKIKILVIANAVTMDNPIFNALGVKDINRAFTKSKNWVIENVMYEKEYDKFNEEAKASDFGRMVKDTSYGDYALNNKFMLDDVSKVKELRVYSKIEFIIVYEDIKISVHNEKGFIYFKEFKGSTSNHFSITPFTSLAKNDIIFMKYNDNFLKAYFTIAINKGYLCSSLKVSNIVGSLIEKSLSTLKT